jgi:hypothetical protein
MGVVKRVNGMQGMLKRGVVRGYEHEEVKGLREEGVRMEASMGRMDYECTL